VLERPGDYTHENFETSNITSVQGLVWMPHDCWTLAHLALACTMAALGVSQLFVGSVVLSYDTLTDSDSEDCGANSVAASLFVLLGAACSAFIWKVFQAKRDLQGKVRAVPPEISRIEQSFFHDPRRWSMVVCCVAFPLCVAAAVVDGVTCVAPLTDIDQCTDSYLDRYPTCSVLASSAPSGVVCACASATSNSAYECSYLTKELPDALAIGSGGVGDSPCDHLTTHLVAWLQLSTVLSSINAVLVFLAVVLGTLSAFSHRACFKPVVLARHEESTFDSETNVFSSLEFTAVKKSIFGRSSETTGPDLF